jgi:putative pyruvate formate lyase activating enzyme
MPPAGAPTKDLRARSRLPEPAYLSLHRRGDLRRRASAALEGLECCVFCPRRCGVDRLSGSAATCRTGRLARVAASFAHFGEEDCLRGWGGSGTIFFSMCSLRCVFCMNHDISQQECAAEVSAEDLARRMLSLQAQGCHNLNLVSPEHVAPQILEALFWAAEGGLQIPIVYNTSGYDAVESLRLMDGVVDIYMPDFKIWEPSAALKYLMAAGYPEAARRAVREMHRQVGDLRIDRNGLAIRGLLVRHLILPGGTAGTREIMEFLAKEVSPDTYVNLMDQYHPAWKAASGEYREIGRPITETEYQEAVSAARLAGIHRLDDRRFGRA